MKHLKYLLIHIFLLKLIKSEYEPAYLKICAKEFKQSVESNQCDKGIWLKAPIEPGCVCIRGVWALSNGFCDERPVIIVGDGHCYHIPFEIRSAKLIGDPHDPFKPKVYVTPLSLDGIYEIKEGDFTPTLMSDSTLIIGVNPRQVAQRKDYGLCIDLAPKDYGKPVHIYVNPRRMSKEWILDRKKEYSCTTTSVYQHHIAFGELFSIAKSKIEPKKLVERHCRQECPGEVIMPPPKARMMMAGRSMGADESGPDGPVQGQGGEDIALFKQRMESRGNGKVATGGEHLKPQRVRGPVKTMEERQQEREEMRANATQEVEHYEREVNEQTLRMMHAHISPLLLNIPGPQVVTREYRYFQHIRVVVEKACPEEYVPKQILKGLMRMFRQLLWETQDTFQHIQSGDDAQFNRTLSRLSECAEKTLDPSVLFATYNESWSAKDNMTEPKPERCPVPIIYAVNGTVYNRTFQKEENQFIRNYTYFFPPHLKYNSSQVDFVIESAWKITMIGHYRCSKYFDDETAIDFSHFFHQVQSFFNNHIIKRWYYEKSVQATYDIVKMIFPSYDLKKFMFGLDSCLAGTQGFSHFDYSNIWIQRPKIPHTQNDLERTKHVLPGATSLLSTKDYAPDPTKKPKKNDKNEKTIGKNDKAPAKSRGKREVKGYHLWNERARCLIDYMDPVLKQEYGYHLPNDCVPPVNPFLGD